MNHGSLFSGIGGFDLPAQWMGWNNVFHCEINPFGSRILKHYWPDAESYEDIKTTDFTIYRGAIDVLSGGFPCQPFSTAGRRKGAEDDRYLWPEMLRAIDEIRPRWVIGENVAGLVSMVQPEVVETDLESQTNLQGEVDSKTVQEYQQYVVETVCRDLEHLGYSVQPIIVPACAIGAPHRRDRIWFIAYASSGGLQGWAGRRGETEDKTERSNLFFTRSRFSTQQPSSDTTDTRPQDVRESEDGFHGSEFIANSTSDRCERKRKGFQTENRAPQSGSAGELERRFKRLRSFGNDPNTNGIRLRGESYWIGKSKFISEDCPGNHWSNFPTQPPVCSGNDGISARLDGITFPKWRAESIKGYGNAVVPQEVYEFFKCIEELESNFNPSAVERPS